MLCTHAARAVPNATGCWTHAHRVRAYTYIHTRRRTYAMENPDWSICIILYRIWCRIVYSRRSRDKHANANRAAHWFRSVKYRFWQWLNAVPVKLYHIVINDLQLYCNNNRTGRHQYRKRTSVHCSGESLNARVNNGQYGGACPGFGGTRDLIIFRR